MAVRAAEIHEERTRLAMQRLVALLVPAITIMMGIAVAGIVASLMTAMLSLNDLASDEGCHKARGVASAASPWRW